MALMDKDALAEYLDVTVTWVRDAITARDLPITWVGKHARFDPVDIDAWLAGNKEWPIGAGPMRLASITGPRPPAGPLTPSPPAGPATPSVPSKRKRVA